MKQPRQRTAEPGKTGQAFQAEITRRNRTEEELRVQSAAFNAAANAIMITDRNGTIQSVNPAFTALTGYTAQEAVGRNPRFLKSGKQDEAVYRKLWQTISSGRVWSGELTNRREDGSLYIEEMTITPVRGADGTIVRYIAIKQDISERKKAEAGAAQLAAIVEYSSDAIISKDLKGTILTWNAAAERLFGYVAGEVIGQNIALLIPENCKAEEMAVLEKVRKGQGVQHYEAVRFKKDGTPLTVSLTISPVKDAAGNTVGTSKIVRDISERKRAEEQILKLNAELEQRVHDRTAQLEAANRELEAFSYSVSHDLRAPLRHIGGFADLLAKAAGPGLPDKNRHYLEQILDSTRQMGCLIDDLLLFSRMGRAEMRLQPVDLEQLVEEAKKQLEPESKGRDIRWKQSALPEVRADKALLRQVMLNLLSNALKYTRPRQPAEIEIGCDGGSPGETVVFVRDNGVGFDMAYVDKLFGVFQRLHLDEEFEGTGIGLATVRRIIARHGGRTWAEGKVNAGATFYFSLPKNNHPPDIYDHTETHSLG
jgi:PAS domain S-box-containing protein